MAECLGLPIFLCHPLRHLQLFPPAEGASLLDV